MRCEAQVSSIVNGALDEFSQAGGIGFFEAEALHKLRPLLWRNNAMEGILDAQAPDVHQKRGHSQFAAGQRAGEKGHSEAGFEQFACHQASMYRQVSRLRRREPCAGWPERPAAR
jgi:hypothetical protein